MKPGWAWLWKAWVAFGIVAELISLKVGTPLTTVVRKYVLGTWWGSGIAGAFLAWLPYHWLFVVSGFGIGDGVAVAVGAGLGAASWKIRWTVDPREGGTMWAVWTLVRSWAWPVLLDIGRILLAYGLPCFTSARTHAAEFENPESQHIPGETKRQRVARLVRRDTQFTEQQLPNYVLNLIIEAALVTVRGPVEIEVEES